jgi:diguanylate cyclase (GGDEF)-like protein
MSARASWSTQQLSEFVAAVSMVASRDELLRSAVELAAEALEAEVGTLVDPSGVLASFGFSAGRAPVAALLALTGAEGETLDVAGVGSCDVLTAPCGDSGRLMVARSGDGFTREEQSLLRAMARVLDLRLEAVSVLEDERRMRERSQRQVLENTRLLDVLRERQALLERLSRIQRSISARKPLHEVLDAVVAGAQALIDVEVVAVRLLDPADPSSMVIASSTGVDDAVLATSTRSPVGSGVGGRAIATNRLVVVDDYSADRGAMDVFVADGLRAVMATPVRHGSTAVGSLLVASRTPGRRYTASEQEVLVALAEHASLAINDARTLEALREAVDAATHDALHDNLTGLPNRSFFLDQLQRAAEESRRHEKGLALLFIDVDDFKLVNDSLGHATGDHLLRVVSERLQAATRGPDVVARLGGDEFAVLLKDCPETEARRIAQRVLDAMAEPVMLTTRLHVSASVGVLWVQSPQESAEDLLRDADVAMYRAKSDGKGRSVIFEHGMRADILERIQLEADLRAAVEAGDQLVLHYQPIVDVSTGVVVGTEALLRWEHPERGLLQPASFISLAEEAGLIGDLGEWALRTACSEAAEWRQERVMRDVGVTVNVSPNQLRSAGLANQVAAALAETGLPASALTLEITESTLVRDVEATVAELTRCKALGVRLAVDDFGTGYSSLSYLASLPLDVLKVDRVFVAAMGRPERGRVLAPAIMALAQSLELLAIAEGVETEEQWHALRALGCERAQGYLFSPPVPVAELSRIVRSRARHQVPRLPRARGELGIAAVN